MAHEHTHKKCPLNLKSRQPIQLHHTAQTRSFTNGFRPYEKWAWLICTQIECNIWLKVWLYLKKFQLILFHIFIHNDWLPHPLPVQMHRVCTVLHRKHILHVLFAVSVCVFNASMWCTSFRCCQLNEEHL